MGVTRAASMVRDSDTSKTDLTVESVRAVKQLQQELKRYQYSWDFPHTIENFLNLKIILFQHTIMILIDCASDTKFSHLYKVITKKCDI